MDTSTDNDMLFDDLEKYLYTPPPPPPPYDPSSPISTPPPSENDGPSTPTKATRSQTRKKGAAQKPPYSLLRSLLEQPGDDPAPDPAPDLREAPCLVPERAAQRTYCESKKHGYALYALRNRQVLLSIYILSAINHILYDSSEIISDTNLFEFPFTELMPVMEESNACCRNIALSRTPSRNCNNTSKAVCKRLKYTHVTFSHISPTTFLLSHTFFMSYT